MNIYPHPVPEGSVGQDLNEVLWRLLLPEHERIHADAWLLGAGSIIDRRLFTLAGPKIVFGSGYNPEQRVPRFGADVDFRAVRGLLTAGALGLDTRCAVCDPGFAVAEWAGAFASSTGAVGLIPHARTEVTTGIAAAASAAGLEVISPRVPIREYLRGIGRCARVYCESLEAAIFADALRVPWARVVISEARSCEFQWRDAFSVLGVSTTPVNRSVLPVFPHAGSTRGLGARSGQLLAENRIAADLYHRRDDTKFRLSDAERLHERLAEFHGRIARLSEESTVTAWAEPQPV